MRALVLLPVFLLGCGNVITQDGSSASSGTSGGASSAASSSSGGWTQCSSPSGYLLCFGPHDCPAHEDPDCKVCFGNKLDHSAGLCATASYTPGGQFPPECVDGDVLIAILGQSPPDTCAPFEAGELFCRNDANALVRYADATPFTCEPLPEPTDCPNLPGIRLCGPGCGGCNTDEICRGRSPSHPHSICLPTEFVAKRCRPDLLCTPTQGCFSFLADATTQADADYYGICMPLADCQAAASNLPGGGKCVPGQ